MSSFIQLILLWLFIASSCFYYCNAEDEKKDNNFVQHINQRIDKLKSHLPLFITFGAVLAFGFIILFFITPCVFIINTCITGCYDGFHRRTLMREEKKIYAGLNARCEVLEVYSKLESVNAAPSVNGGVTSGNGTTGEGGGQTSAQQTTQGQSTQQ